MVTRDGKGRPRSEAGDCRQQNGRNHGPPAWRSPVAAAADFSTSSASTRTTTPRRTTCPTGTASRSWSTRRATCTSMARRSTTTTASTAAGSSSTTRTSPRAAAAAAASRSDRRSRRAICQTNDHGGRRFSETAVRFALMGALTALSLGVRTCGPYCRDHRRRPSSRRRHGTAGRPSPRSSSPCTRRARSASRSKPISVRSGIWTPCRDDPPQPARPAHGDPFEQDRLVDVGVAVDPDVEAQNGWLTPPEMMQPGKPCCRMAWPRCEACSSGPAKTNFGGGIAGRWSARGQLWSYRFNCGWTATRSMFAVVVGVQRPTSRQ